jgi:hypothetical protein
MKTISSLAAIFVVALFANPMVASEQVPLNGSFAAVEIDEVQGTTLFVNGSGTGNATHLGRYTVTFEAKVDLLTLMGVGTMTFVAANGDTLSTEFNGQATPTSDPNIFLVVELETITDDGTGRFADAAGSFRLERVIDLTTGLSSGSFSGTISNPAP